MQGVLSQIVHAQRILGITLLPNPVSTSLLRATTPVAAWQGITTTSAATQHQSSMADASVAAATAEAPRPQPGVAPTGKESTILPSHHIPGARPGKDPRFTNPWPEWEKPKSFKEALKWQWERRKLKHNVYDGWLEGIDNPTKDDFKRAFPLKSPNWEVINKAEPDTIKALWVGHATVLARVGTLSLITDPCFSERCAPVQWTGPKRLVPPAFEPEDPNLKLDVVLLSHNHYDHLDVGSVKRLYKRYGDKLTWYVPLGVKEWFKNEGVINVIEMDWWEEHIHEASGAKITFVPAQHWTARGIFDRCHTLWGGYVVQAKSGPKFYFVGDTGYCGAFKEIGERLGPMDLSAIPIGAYDPRWFMKGQHVDPEEGLQIHHDVRSRRSMSIHCCTWSLCDEALDEPPKRLVKALAESKSDPNVFVTLQHGETIVVRDGQTLNAPKLLGLSTPAAAAGAASGSV